MLPFPTKYKDESVDDYLQYQVTQPLCHLGGGKEAWPKKPTVFFFSLSLWLSIESSGDASKPGINLSFGKVATLKKKSVPALQCVNPTTVGLQRPSKLYF